MLEKRSFSCLIVISQGYYCLQCAKTRKILNQRYNRAALKFSPKRATLITTPKSNEKMLLQLKRNELLRKM